MVDRREQRTTLQIYCTSARLFFWVGALGSSMY